MSVLLFCKHALCIHLCCHEYGWLLLIRGSVHLSHSPVIGKLGVKNVILNLSIISSSTVSSDSGGLTIIENWIICIIGVACVLSFPGRYERCPKRFKFAKFVKITIFNMLFIFCRNLTGLLQCVWVRHLNAKILLVVYTTNRCIKSEVISNLYNKFSCDGSLISPPPPAPRAPAPPPPSPRRSTQGVSLLYYRSLRLLPQTKETAECGTSLIVHYLCIYLPCFLTLHLKFYF